MGVFVGENNLVWFIKSFCHSQCSRFTSSDKVELIVLSVSLKNNAVKFGRLTAQRRCSGQDNQLLNDQYSDLNYSV